MSFLGLEGRVIVVFGVANKKSVAYHIGKLLHREGAVPVYVVRSEERKKNVAKILANSDVYVCDVEKEGEIENLADQISKKYTDIYGIVHSIAFANYSEGF